MKNAKFYPHNLMQSVVFIGIYILITGVVFFFFNLFTLNDILTHDLFIAIIASASSGILLSIFHLRNRVKGLKVNYGVKLKAVALIPLLLIILLIFQIGIVLPITEISCAGIEVKSQNTFKSVIYILNVLILAPILEEFIFRGFILKGLLTTYSAKRSIAISSILFGLIHINWADLDIVQVFNAICIGVFLGWMYYETNSLSLSILLHSFGNLLGLTVMYLRYKLNNVGYFSTSYNDEIINWVVLGCSSFLLLFLVQLLYKKVKEIEFG